MKNNQPEKNEKLEGSRNSVLRKITSMPAEKIAEFLYNLFPNITPNEITAMGTTGLMFLVLYVALLEKESRINSSTSRKLIIILLGLTATDALDGSLARYLQSLGIKYKGEEFGPEFDSLSDRIQEAFMSWLAIYRAAHQDDKLWLATATLSALSNPMSSLFRANAEMNGVIVPESGGDILGFWGTRAGRLFISLTHVLPRSMIGPVSIQAVLDGLMTVATTKTAVQRLRAVGLAKNNVVAEKSHSAVNSDFELDEKTKNSAQRRFKLLAGLAVITTSITGIVFAKSIGVNRENLSQAIFPNN